MRQPRALRPELSGLSALRGIDATLPAQRCSARYRMGHPHRGSMSSILRQFFAVQPIDPHARSRSDRLNKVLRAPALIAIGIGATIGSGIFVLTGTVAANNTGPALTLSLLIAAFGSGLAALCYSEFASFLPVS